MSDAWFYNTLRCPDCNSNLEIKTEILCTTCGFLDKSCKDLRPLKPRHIQVSFLNMSTVIPVDALNQIDTTHPVLTYKGPNAIRDSRQLMSEISLRLPSGGTVLDLGCGPRDQYMPLSYLGFHYVGIDHNNTAADFLADAHALPFQDKSFDCVFSYAVIEHLYNPFLAIREISRVLKPGGWFIGTVSQGEPFHNSYFHHTPWGLLSLISNAPDLRIIKMWDSSDTLRSLASMGRYSRILKAALAGLNFANDWLPWLTPRKMMWPDKEKQLDRLYRAGSICFSIEKHQ